MCFDYQDGVLGVYLRSASANPGNNILIGANGARIIDARGTGDESRYMFTTHNGIHMDFAQMIYPTLRLWNALFCVSSWCTFVTFLMWIAYIILAFVLPDQIGYASIVIGISIVGCAALEAYLCYTTHRLNRILGEDLV